MKVQVVSDLHLNFQKIKEIPVLAEVLVIAGDSSNGSVWINSLLPLVEDFDYVLVVMGNHEYYSHANSTLGIRKTNEAIKKRLALDFPNVELLDNSYTVYNGKVIYGGTMWTPLDNGEGDGITLARHYMNDFHFVTPREVIDENKLFHENLERTVHKEGYIDLVVSHHAPHERSIAEKFSDSFLNHCYVDKTAKKNFRNVLTWVHGHTHTSFDYCENGTRIVANPRGYVNWKNVPENPEFNLGYVIEI